MEEMIEDTEKLLKLKKELDEAGRRPCVERVTLEEARARLRAHGRLCEGD